MSLKNVRYLIAYFSRKGDNYVDGRIMNLTVGNTEVAAGMINELIRGNLFRIEPVNAYPVDYTETTEVAKRELSSNARPKLTGHVKDMDSYEVVILGYPIWWSTMPMPIYTYLEQYDFSRKTIAPFCTHEGSGLGHSEADITRLCPNATILQGLAIRGGDVKNARNEISKWLRKLGTIK